jgi:hypothetical protein
LEGDELTSYDQLSGASIVLVISAVEDVRSDQVNVEVEAIKQRTGVPREYIVLARLEEDGDEIVLPPQLVQIVLDSPTPLGASPEVSGGVASYVPGTLIFPDRDADVQGGDRFKYMGSLGQVTGVPVVASDRKEARMRLYARGT